MDILIYNINSFGGNYEYAKCIFDAYASNAEVRSCKMLMPANADTTRSNIFKILYPDIPSSSNKLYRKAHFLYRSFVNPFRLFKFLKGQETSVVLFNDFDQTTAPFWAPFFRLLKNKHRFAVILHDPDRDNYFSIKTLSRYTMKSIMSFMRIAFYHGYLPDKDYYKGNFLKVKIPHGIYNNTVTDEIFLLQLKELGERKSLIGALGNIRPEKNYEVIIEAMRQLPDAKLLIAGNVANSSVSIEYYKEFAQKMGVQERIIWVIEYLSQPRFNAAIQACDVIALYYKPSFTSQSGILNAIVPFRKKLVVSDAESSLKESIMKFSLGKIVPHDDINAFGEAVQSLLDPNKDGLSQCWEGYIQGASWENHVSIAVEHYKNILNEF